MPGRGGRAPAGSGAAELPPNDSCPPIGASRSSRFPAGWGLSARSQVRKGPGVVTAQRRVNDKLSLLWQRVGRSGSSRRPSCGHPAGSPKAGAQRLLRLSWARGRKVGPFHLIHAFPLTGPVQSPGEKEPVIFSSWAVGGACWPDTHMHAVS